jgi:hypothetical protein
VAAVRLTTTIACSTSFSRGWQSVFLQRLTPRDSGSKWLYPQTRFINRTATITCHGHHFCGSFVAS